MPEIFGINIDNKNKNIILALGIFIATFLLCLNIIKTSARKADQIRGNIYEISEKNILRKDIENIEKRQREYAIYFYDSIDQSTLRSIVTNIVREAGCEIVSIKPLTREIIGNTFKESLDMSLRSTYNQFGAFVSRLENLERITKIESVSVEQYSDFKIQESMEKSQTEIREPGSDLSVSLVISAYAIKE